jgi:serine/threonine-protein kinase HipA
VRLAVELYGIRVGTLDGDARTFDFDASAAGIEAFGVNSVTLSVAIPLSPQGRRDHSARRRNWFGELLPEGDQYSYMLAEARLKREDTPSFLARYGRDVAGAVELWNVDDPTEPSTPSLNRLTKPAIRALMEDPMGSPLANAPRSGKSSLGGVQPKILLVREGGGWAQALGGYPTTHILKPQLQNGRETVIFDEEYGSRIARRLKLADFETSIDDFAGLPALVIERYDRVAGRRIHQEDFSQTLGARGNEKYQEIGGVVSLRRVAEVLTRSAPERNLRILARMVVLAVGIGNLDMHTKNLGLLHAEDEDVTLAPAYDVVPQAHMPGDGKLALAVNKKYRHRDITRDDLLAEFSSWGLRRASLTLDEAVDELQLAISQEKPLAGAYPLLQQRVTEFVDNLSRGLPLGGREP